MTWFFQRRPESTFMGWIREQAERFQALREEYIGAELDVELKDLPPMTTVERARGALEHLCAASEVEETARVVEKLLEHVHGGVLAYQLKERNLHFQAAEEIVNLSPPKVRTAIVELPETALDEGHAPAGALLAHAGHHLNRCIVLAKRGGAESNRDLTESLKLALDEIIGAGRALA